MSKSKIDYICPHTNRTQSIYDYVYKGKCCSRTKKVILCLSCAVMELPDMLERDRAFRGEIGRNMDAFTGISY